MVAALYAESEVNSSLFMQKLIYFHVYYNFLYAYCMLFIHVYKVAPS